MARKFRLWVLLCIFFMPVSVTADDGFSKVVIFGDSLSDTGNMYMLTGGQIPPDPPYYKGRTSNGLLWHEYMLDRLNLEEGISVNHAWAGANTGRSNAFDTDSIGFPGFHDAIDMYLASLGAGGTGADADALYIVWIGANDFLDPPADPYIAIQQAVANIVSGLFRLKEAGAKHFMLINMPDLGLTPAARATGQSSEMTSISYALNTVLQENLQQLDMNILLADVFSLLNRVTEQPQRYRLQNVTDSCLNATSGECPDAGDYLYWDHVHPTTRGHEIVAKSFRQCLKTHRACFSDHQVTNKHRQNEGFQDLTDLTGTDSFCSCSANSGGEEREAYPGNVAEEILAEDSLPVAAKTGA